MAAGEQVTCWRCETEVPRALAVVVYRDQQGGLHAGPDVRGLWLAEYLCPECAESEGVDS
jgi:hypothetical protein